VGGAAVISRLEPSLSSITFPNGKVIKYSFGLTAERLPTMVSGDNLELVYTWNPVTRAYLSDGTWSYTTARQGTAFTQSRRNKQGEEEFLTQDTRGFTIRKLRGEPKRITQFFTSGVLNGKVRKVDEEVNGVVKTIYSCSYDEQGNKIRELTNGLQTWPLRDSVTPISQEIAYTTLKSNGTHEVKVSPASLGSSTTYTLNERNEITSIKHEN
jgi:hypothetical protein